MNAQEAAEAERLQKLAGVQEKAARLMALSLTIQTTTNTLTTSHLNKIKERLDHAEQILKTITLQEDWMIHIRKENHILDWPARE